MPDGLYERDFFAWTQDQASALRQAQSMRPNVPGVDFAHLAEEVEDMGNDTLDKIEGLLVQIIAHLLKLAHSPLAGPRNHWIVEVTTWRRTVARRAKRSPSALQRVDLDELTRDALDALRRDEVHRTWAATLPTTCPFPMDQVLDPDVIPGPVDGNR